jgi:hypothetical protein
MSEPEPSTQQWRRDGRPRPQPYPRHRPHEPEPTQVHPAEAAHAAPEHFEVVDEVEPAEAGYVEAEYVEAGQAEPGQAESGYAESGYAESGYAEAGYAEAGYAEQPEYVDPARQRGPRVDEPGAGYGEEPARYDESDYPSDDVVHYAEYVEEGPDEVPDHPSPEPAGERSVPGSPDEPRLGRRVPQSHLAPELREPTELAPGPEVPLRPEQSESAAHALSRYQASRSAAEAESFDRGSHLNGTNNGHGGHR